MDIWSFTYLLIISHFWILRRLSHHPTSSQPGADLRRQYVLPIHMNVQPSFQCECFSPSQKQLLNCIRMRYVNVHLSQNSGPTYTNFMFGLTHPSFLHLFPHTTLYIFTPHSTPCIPLPTPDITPDIKLHLINIVISLHLSLHHALHYTNHYPHHTLQYSVH